MDENNTKPTICIACLQCSVECIDMISTRIHNSSYVKSLTYLDCYRACTQLDIEDGQTVHICLSCSNDLIDAYKFIIKARNSYGIIMGIRMDHFGKPDEGNSHTFQTLATTKEIQIKQEFSVPKKDQTSLPNLIKKEIGNNCDSSIEPNDTWTQDVIQKSAINSQRKDEFFVIQKIEGFHHINKDFNSNQIPKSFIQTNHNEEQKSKNYENLLKSQKPYPYSKKNHLTQNTTSSLSITHNKLFNREEFNSVKAEKQKHKLNSQKRKAAYMREYRARKKTEALFLEKGKLTSKDRFNFNSDKTGIKIRIPITKVSSIKIQKQQQQSLFATEPLKSFRNRLKTTTSSEASRLVQVEYYQEPPPSLSSTFESSDPHNTTSSMDSYINYTKPKRILSDHERSEFFRVRNKLGQVSNGGGADRVRNHRARKRLAEASGGVIKKDQGLSDAERSRNYRARKNISDAADTAANTVKKGKPLSDAERSRNYRARKKMLMIEQ